jgi:hypothetical protein
MEFPEIELDDSQRMVTGSVRRNRDAVFHALTHDEGKCACARTARILLDMANWPEELFLFQYRKGMLSD